MRIAETNRHIELRENSIPFPPETLANGRKERRAVWATLKHAQRGEIRVRSWNQQKSLWIGCCEYAVLYLHAHTERIWKKSKLGITKAKCQLRRSKALLHWTMLSSLWHTNFMQLPVAEMTFVVLKETGINGCLFRPFRSPIVTRMVHQKDTFVGHLQEISDTINPLEKFQIFCRKKQENVNTKDIKTKRWKMDVPRFPMKMKAVGMLINVHTIAHTCLHNLGKIIERVDCMTLNLYMADIFGAQKMAQSSNHMVPQSSFRPPLGRAFWPLQLWRAIIRPWTGGTAHRFPNALWQNVRAWGLNPTTGHSTWKAGVLTKPMAFFLESWPQNGILTSKNVLVVVEPDLQGSQKAINYAPGCFSLKKEFPGTPVSVTSSWDTRRASRRYVGNRSVGPGRFLWKEWYQWWIERSLSQPKSLGPFFLETTTKYHQTLVLLCFCSWGNLMKGLFWSMYNKYNGLTASHYLYALVGPYILID